MEQANVRDLSSNSHLDFLIRNRAVRFASNTESPRVPSQLKKPLAHCEQIVDALHDLDFEVDGLVVKLNRFEHRDELGARSKSPRWLIAYKWEKYEAVTKL